MHVDEQYVDTDQPGNVSGMHRDTSFVKHPARISCQWCLLCLQQKNVLSSQGQVQSQAGGILADTVDAQYSSSES
jgi:hypothetical protein